METGGRVKADGVADTGVLARIIRQDNGDSLLGIGGLPEPRPVARQISDVLDAVGARLVADDVRLQDRIVSLRVLERNRCGNDPPIELRQSDVHGEVARRQPGDIGRPDILAARAEDRLENGNIQLLQLEAPARAFTALAGAAG